jgi:hypothetical protein
MTRCEDHHLQAGAPRANKQVPPSQQASTAELIKAGLLRDGGSVAAITVARLLPSRSGSSVRRRPPSCASLLL